MMGENISVWMSPFRFESLCGRDAECDESLCNEGGPYLVVGGMFLA